jgi:hypothetical protein
MLLEEHTDDLTAMASSIALVWNNLPVMLAWGAIVPAFCSGCGPAGLDRGFSRWDMGLGMLITPSGGRSDVKYKDTTR